MEVRRTLKIMGVILVVILGIFCFGVRVGARLETSAPIEFIDCNGLLPMKCDGNFYKLGEKINDTFICVELNYH